MSQMTGADVVQLRDLANVMDSEAGRLSALRNRIAGRLLTTAWSGPDAARFKGEWLGHVLGLTLAILEFTRCATELRKNADEQDQASAARGNYYLPVDTPKSPTSTAGLLAAGDAAGPDGVRIQKVIGPDGNERYIVYIGGTGAGGNPWDSNNPFDAYENAAAIADIDSETSISVKQAMLRAGINSSSDVMFVGYSQGGIIAQNLARHINLDNPPVVITRGSPQVAGSMGRVDILRIEVKDDPVVELGGGIYAVGNDLSRMVGLDRGSGTDYKYTHDAHLGVAIDLIPGARQGGGAAVHGSPTMYQEAANAFDNDQSGDAQVLRNRIGQFEGSIIVADTDPVER